MIIITAGWAVRRETMDILPTNGQSSLTSVVNLIPTVSLVVSLIRATCAAALGSAQVVVSNKTIPTVVYTKINTVSLVTRLVTIVRAAGGRGTGIAV